MSIPRIVGVLVTFIWLITPATYAEAPPLTLSEAVRIAITTKDPSLERYEARAQAQEDLSVADAQIVDPKITATAQNFPVDTFSFGQEAMTQLRLGVHQDLPSGHTRQIRGARRRAEASAERIKRDAQIYEIALQVRIAWLTNIGLSRNWS